MDADDPVSFVAEDAEGPVLLKEDGAEDFARIS